MTRIILRAEKFLFYLMFFILPFQKRVVLFHWGWRFNEWQSISFYLTDLVLIGLFVAWGIRAGFNPRNLNIVSRFKNLKLVDKFLILFAVVALLSVIGAPVKILGFYQWLRLLEVIVFYFYLSRYAFTRFSLEYSAIALVLGGLFQALAGTGQFLAQNDLGLQILGESVLLPDLRGVAVFINQAGDKIMRAYGILPHPNVLAGFLFVVLMAFYWIAFYEKDKRIWKIILAMGAVIQFGFLATFSRTTIFFWVLFAGVMAFWFWFKNKNKEERTRAKIILLVSLAVAILFGAVFWSEVISRLTISYGEEAVQMRIYYGREALGSGSMLNVNWLGVGFGNFVPWLMSFDKTLTPNLYQPVHNIYLLLYSETGIVGIGLFLAFLFFLLRGIVRNSQSQRSKIFILASVAVFLALGFFDHYPLTLQQGRLLFWGYLGLIRYLIR